MTALFFIFMPNWTLKPQPFGPNRSPALFGTSSVDGVTPVPVAVDPATGAFIIEGSGTAYTDGQVSPAHPVGTIPVFNNAGTITAVSKANPLPVNATLTVESIEIGTVDQGTPNTIGNAWPTLETTGLVPKVYDSLTYTNTSVIVDTYKYYTSGVSGTLVATLTITWTDSTKTVLTSVVRT